ncbi:MAG: hypothetical protein Q7T59_05605 [Candidatus Woesebacteria bacterium]|nr:hypothetical protein [Candidatus Woesebacteria bacterium]
MNTAHKIVSISLDPDKHKELKIKALNAGMTLSNYLSVAGTITNVDSIQKFTESNSGVPTQE